MKQIITFASVHFVMKAEKIFKKEGIDIRLIPTPRKISSDCGMAIEAHYENIERIKTILGNHKCGVDGIYIFDEREVIVNKKIDARGLACPKPVVMTKNALEEMEAGTVEVLVDNKPAVENVSRFARNSGCEVKTREESEDFIVEITKEATSKVSEEEIVCHVESQKTGKGITVLIESDAIGRGSDELGAILMRALFPTLLEASPRPRKLIFMNSGVKLTVEGSVYLEDISKLEKEGREIFVCGTCLDFFNLKDTVKVGKISNFFEITQTLVETDKVITI